MAVSIRRQAGAVDFLLTHRRNATAARRFLAKALRSRQDWPPHVINTDKNPAYGEALRQLKRDDPDAEIIEHTLDQPHSPTESCRTTPDYGAS